MQSTKQEKTDSPTKLAFPRQNPFARVNPVLKTGFPVDRDPRKVAHPRWRRWGQLPVIQMDERTREAAVKLARKWGAEGETMRAGS